MNELAITFLVINIALLLLLPRRWAPLPLIMGASYMTLAQGIEIGPFHFTFLRLAIAGGVLRAIIRFDRPAGGIIFMDWLMLLWAAWALFASAFHANPTAALILRLGTVYNACGVYFLVRVLCQSLDDVVLVIRMIAVVFGPLALSMLFEKFFGYNFFSLLGGVQPQPEVRAGLLRAQGPFLHPILAGTMGALCLPLMIGLWINYRRTAAIGVFSCLAMIFASASSGPILSAAAAVVALFAWYLRNSMQLIRRLIVVGYIFLDLVMKAPVYFLLARADVLGGSTGYHRAALIDAAITHFNEWWFAGADYTRHWLPYGVVWSPDHIDITNQFISLGVMSGLPVMLLHIYILAKGFSYIGLTTRDLAEYLTEPPFVVWTLGVGIFTYVVSSLGVSYFDQSFLFIYMILAGTASIWASIAATDQLPAYDSYQYA